MPPQRWLDCPTCSLSGTELLERRPGCAACLVRRRRARAWLAEWTGAPLWDCATPCADPDFDRSTLLTPSMRAIVHVILPEQPDHTRAAVLRARALDACPPGPRPGAAVTVDFTATARLDVAGARHLRELARTLGARGYRVRAVGAREPVRDLMRFVGADAWMPFADGTSAGGAAKAAG